MPVTDAETKTQRLLALQMLFWRNPRRGFRTAEIAAHLGVTERTARNYLDELSTSGRLPIYKEGWEWRLMEGAHLELLPVNLDLEEGAQLYLAARLLARHSDEPHPAIRTALIKLISAMPPTLSGHLERLVQGLPTGADALFADVFHTIAYGWATRRAVQLEYHPLKTGPYRARFCPYLLEPSAIGYTVYAIGHSDPPDALRTYKLERITQAALSDEPFDLPEDFDGLALLQKAWGVMYGEEVQTVRLRFAAGTAARRVQETVWHPSQRFRQLEDGRVEWSAQVGDWLEMLPWVRGWGADVEVVGPERLRETLVGETSRLSKLYQVALSKAGAELDGVLKCWGKTGNTTSSYHPALFHMLDVGYVARTLLSAPASPRWRTVLADALDTDPNMLVTWLPYIVAVHDIGKLSPAFQALKEDQIERLQAQGLVFSPWRQGLDIHHSQVSQVFVQDCVSPFALPNEFRQAWVDMVGGHHGRFRPRSGIKRTRASIQQYEPTPWQEIREKADAVLQARLLAPGVFQLPEPSDVSTATMALTGFSILCDWLGSDETVFPPEPDLDLETYCEASQARAARAAQSAGFLTPSLSHAPTRFVALFPDKDPPRPLQRAVDEIPESVLEAPCLAIIEAPTGEGKTEAALALAHRLAQGTGCDELYYALPTTGTSNQMFQRVQNYLGENLNLPLEVKLIHGLAFLIEDELRVEPLDNADSADRSSMIEWSTSKKRAMVAPFGVGTVDQAELAVLNVKHSALRLIGLAGKVLIFDEVHAYDTYMTTIVETLLQWLSALGTSAIILSATLPQVQRAVLARAYGGEWIRAPEQMDAYPSLWVVRSGHLPHHAAPQALQSDRQIQLRELHLTDRESKAKAEWLLDAVTGGGCACWITNTVDRAQRVFEALGKQAPPDVDLMLLHARFPLEERLGREQQLIEKYGPGGARPKKGIVVGTQVLEQSLDLDFDVMVSDLAPMDLLLQRAGRLQRHDNERPPAYVKQTELWINTPLKGDGTSDLSIDEAIYDAFLLQRTGQVLEGRDSLHLPGDYRQLVESVYGIGDVPVDGPLAEAWKKLQRKKADAVKEAKLRLMPEPDREWSFVSRAAQLAFEEDETGAAWIVAQTRLGRESVNLIPLTPEGNLARLYPTEEAVALDRPVSRDLQLRLLRRHLRVSRPEIVHAVKREELPVLFTKSARLRGYYPLWLTEGKAEFPSKRGMLIVTLDPDQGLVIRAEKGE